jgi:hypothetical protein
VFGPTKYPLALALNKYATYIRKAPLKLSFYQKNITLEIRFLINL